MDGGKAITELGETGGAKFGQQKQEFYFGRVNFATSLRHSRGNISLGICENLELSRDKYLGIFTIQTLYENWHPATLLPSLQQYGYGRPKELSLISFVKEGYAVTNKGYFRNKRITKNQAI